MATEKRLIDANVLKQAFRTKDGASALGHSVSRLFKTDLIIDAQPTVDAVEVVHGRWIVENEASIRCSECCFNRASIKMPMDYCSNCGADMRERITDEDN